MTKMRALVLLLLVMAVCSVVALPVAVLVDLFPAWVGLLVLVGVLVPGLLLSLLAARWLVGNRRAEFAARLQQRQAIIIWACVVAAIGGFPGTVFGNRVVEVVGLVITAAGGCVAFWAVLRAVPEKADRNTQSPSAG
jgi:hypothetical protein